MACIETYVRRSMSAASYSKLTEIEVNLPGDTLFGASSKRSILAIPISDSDSKGKSKAEKIQEITTCLGECWN